MDKCALCEHPNFLITFLSSSIFKFVSGAGYIIANQSTKTLSFYARGLPL